MIDSCHESSKRCDQKVLRGKKKQIDQPVDSKLDEKRQINRRATECEHNAPISSYFRVSRIPNIDCVLTFFMTRIFLDWNCDVFGDMQNSPLTLQAKRERTEVGLLSDCDVWTVHR